MELGIVNSQQEQEIPRSLRSRDLSPTKARDLANLEPVSIQLFPRGSLGTGGGVERQVYTRF